VGATAIQEVVVEKEEEEDCQLGLLGVQITEVLLYIIFLN
jgi:hypothetical protein